MKYSEQVLLELLILLGKSIQIHQIMTCV